MEKKQNSVTRSIMIKVAIALFVSSSLASIVVILLNKTEDLRGSWLTVGIFIALTLIRPNINLTWFILLFFILASVNVACQVYPSYLKNVEALDDTALTAAICELTVGFGLILGCLLARASWEEESNETIADRTVKSGIMYWLIFVLPPYNLSIKVVPLAYLCLFRQGSVGHSDIEKRVFRFVGQLMERFLLERSSLELPPV